jgi:hypothetical protein
MKDFAAISAARAPLFSPMAEGYNPAPWNYPGRKKFTTEYTENTEKKKEKE